MQLPTSRVCEGELCLSSFGQVVRDSARRPSALIGHGAVHVSDAMTGPLWDTEAVLIVKELHANLRGKPSRI